MHNKCVCVLVVIAAVLIFLPAVSAAYDVNSPGYIDVSSSPSGALVYIDGTYEGSTPLTISVDGDISHSVEVTYVGYEGYLTYVFSGPGEISYVYADLIPVPAPSAAYLSISSNPSGALAYVDGSYEGSTPLTVSVAPGSHSVRLEYVGYYSWSDTAYAYDSRTTSVYGSLNLVPNPPAPTNVPTYVPNPVSGSGDLYITSDPSLAEVYVDNAYKGFTPITVTADGGYHTVRIESSGYSGWSDSVFVTADQTATVYAALTPNPSPTKSPVPLTGLLGLAGAALLAVRRII